VTTVDLRGAPRDEVTIRFDVPLNLVDANTFSEVIAGFSDAIVAINSRVEPDYPIEVQLAGISYGSVFAKLKLTPRELVIAAGAIVASHVVVPIVPNILAAYLYDSMKASDPQMTISISKDGATYTTPSATFIIDRDAFEKAA